MGGAVLVTFVTAIVIIGVRSASPPSPPSPLAASAPRPAANQLTVDQLRPGDCLAGSNMFAEGTKQWPEYVTRVACTQWHEGEVFFAGQVWAQSLAYPGSSTVISQANGRCEFEFAAYDGIEIDQSAFSAVAIVPDSPSWASGTRSVTCVAYEPDPTGEPGPLPVNSSIKGTGQ